ncbi:hypothetical protein ACM66B_002396 [Microbotryomycetes sp. NB124-2]
MSTSKEGGMRGSHWGRVAAHLVSSDTLTGRCARRSDPRDNANRLRLVEANCMAAPPGSSAHDASLGLHDYTADHGTRPTSSSSANRFGAVDLTTTTTTARATAYYSPRPSTTTLSDTVKKRKIVSCLDCHSRKVKCSKTRPVCEQCIKRGKQDTCAYELASDDEEYLRVPSSSSTSSNKRPALMPSPRSSSSVAPAATGTSTSNSLSSSSLTGTESAMTSMSLGLVRLPSLDDADYVPPSSSASSATRVSATSQPAHRKQPQKRKTSSARSATQRPVPHDEAATAAAYAMLSFPLSPPSPLSASMSSSLTANRATAAHCVKDDLLKQDDAIGQDAQVATESLIGYIRAAWAAPELASDASTNVERLQLSTTQLSSFTADLDTAADDDDGAVAAFAELESLPREMVANLVSTYLSCFNEPFPMYHPDHLRRFVFDVIAADEATRRSRPLANVQILFVLGLATSRQSRFVHLSQRFLKQAQSRLCRHVTDQSRSTSIGVVRSRMLMSLWLHDRHEYDEAWFQISRAVSDAGMLGLHRAELGQPFLWNALVRLSLVQTLVTGRPTQLDLLPLVKTFDSGPSFDTVPFHQTNQTFSSAAFTRLLLEATRLQAAGTSEEDDDDDLGHEFEAFERRVRTMSVMPDRDQVRAESSTSSLSHAQICEGDTLTGLPLFGMMDEKVTVQQRIVYFVLTRLLLLNLRRAFVGTDDSKTESGGVKSDARADDRMQDASDSEDVYDRQPLSDSLTLVNGLDKIALHHHRVVGTSSSSGHSTPASVNGSVRWRTKSKSGSPVNDSSSVTAVDVPILPFQIGQPNGVKGSLSITTTRGQRRDSRFGSLHQAVGDAREIVAALRVMRERFPEMAKEGGLLKLAALTSAIVLCSYTLRHTWSPASDGAKIDLMYLAVVLNESRDEDVVANAAWDTLLRHRTKYLEKQDFAAWVVVQDRSTEGDGGQEGSEQTKKEQDDDDDMMTDVDVMPDTWSFDPNGETTFGDLDVVTDNGSVVLDWDDDNFVSWVNSLAKVKRPCQERFKDVVRKPVVRPVVRTDSGLSSSVYSTNGGVRGGSSSSSYGVGGASNYYSTPLVKYLSPLPPPPTALVPSSTSSSSRNVPAPSLSRVDSYTSVKSSHMRRASSSFASTTVDRSSTVDPLSKSLSSLPPPSTRTVSTDLMSCLQRQDWLPPLPSTHSGGREEVVMSDGEHGNALGVYTDDSMVVA